MPPLSQEQMVAVLQAYQDELTAAAQQGPSQYDKAFANPPPNVAVHEFDTEGVIQRVNAEEPKVLGFEVWQIVGHHVWEFVVMQEVSRESVQKKLAGEKDIKPFVRTFRRADGTGVAMLLVDRRLQDASGQPMGIRTAMMAVEDEGKAP